MRTMLRAIACLAVLLTLAGPTFAQEFRATVTGRVSDSTGGRMPGVTVTITNTQTNEVITAVTNDEGTLYAPVPAPRAIQGRGAAAGIPPVRAVGAARSRPVANRERSAAGRRV